jgi:ABC-type nitrate/sulfonate/bicarbonate transport system substrate-binding protein
MADYQPIDLNVQFRAGHSTLWELADKSGVLAQLNMKLASLQYTESSSKAEASLFAGSCDVVAGNHISPYAKVAQGKPIVCLASPGNQVRDSVISREPISSVADLRGRRIADTAIEDPIGGYHHIRGNHMLEIKRAGLEIDDVEWVVVADYMGEEFQKAQLDAMTSGKTDATFVAGGTETYEQAGFHVLKLDPLPMITGPTITTAINALAAKDQLGERMVKAMVMTVHFARTQPEEASRMLGLPSAAFPEGGRGGRAASMARLPMKPYPDPMAVANAYELCCMQYPEAREVSPLALWDMHYLRELDNSGFIDELASERR